jgi:O-antigen/teichoic acid export membrane protein
VAQSDDAVRAVVSVVRSLATGAYMKRIDDLSVKSKVFISVLAQAGSQSLGAVLAVVLLKIVTARLGAPDYGIYATVIAFVSTFSLFTDLGLNAITSREIAKRPEAASQIISENMAFRLALSCVTVPILGGLGLLIYPHQSRDLHVGIALFALDLLVDSVRSVALTYYTSRARNDVVALVMACNQLAFLGFALLALHGGYGVRGVIAAYLAGDLLGAIVSVTLVRRKIAIRIRVRPHAWRMVARISLPLGIIQIVNILYFKADSILISVIKGPIQVGYYGVAYSVIGALLGVPSMIMSPLMPSMATARDLTPIVQRAFKIMVTLALPMGVGGFLLRRQIILAISTKQFLPAVGPFGILVIASVFTFGSTVFGFASVAADTHRRLVRISVLSLVSNIALNLLLIPHWGIKGAAFATAVTEVVSATLTYRVFALANRTRIPVFDSILRPALASLLLVPADLLLRHFWASVHGVSGVLIAVAVLGTVYIVALVVMGDVPPEFTAMWYRIRKQPTKGSRRRPKPGRRRRPRDDRATLAKPTKTIVDPPAHGGVPAHKRSTRPRS